MRQHETWTGAANPGDKTFGVGSVEGSVFTVSFTIKSNIWKTESSMDLFQLISLENIHLFRKFNMQMFLRGFLLNM